MSDFAPSARAGNGLDPTKRVNYQLGLVLGEDEFRQDQLYHRERDHAATRALHGYGTVSGLAVTLEDGEIRVAPGLAVDPAGHLICVPTEYCADLDTWLNDKLDPADFADPPSIPGPVTLYVVLCYDECETDEVPVPAESCVSADESRAASRIMESFQLRIVASPPAAAGELAPGSLANLAETVDAIWGSLDPDAGSPPDYAAAAAAVRAWAVEQRPQLAGATACVGPDDECVALAAIDVDVDAGSGGDLTAAAAAVDDEFDRPVLVSTRFLQEALLRVAPADHEHELGELIDVDTSGVADADVLTFAGGTWEPRSPAHGHELDDLDDVSVGEPAAGDVLTFGEGGWTSAPPAGGGGGVTAHGDLTDLEAVADHPQYLAVDGSRPLGGDWSAGGNRIGNLPDSAGPGEPITHGRAAGGDLTGQYPDPRIAELQGNPVDAAGPGGRDTLLFGDGRWVARVPTVLPIATIRAVDNQLFNVWFHLDVTGNRVAVEELNGASLQVRSEINNNSRPRPVRGLSFSQLRRNFWQVGVPTGAPLLRFEFHLADLVLDIGQSALEWASEQLIWFVGQGAADDPVVTVHVLNPFADDGGAGRFEIDPVILDAIRATDGGSSLLDALTRQPTRPGPTRRGPR